MGTQVWPLEHRCVTSYIQMSRGRWGMAQASIQMEQLMALRKASNPKTWR